MKTLKTALKHVSGALFGVKKPEPKGVWSYDLAPIAAAAKAGEIAELTFFLDKYDVKQVIGVTRSIHTGWSILHHAAKQGHLDVLGLLLGRGANIHDPNNDGDTPLHVAASHGQKDSIAFLLDAGARTDIVNAWGFQPLAVAAAKGHKESAELLLSRRVDINAASPAGVTALHKAVGHPATMKLLIDHGANMEAQDIGGWTPLMWSAGGTDIENRAHSASVLLGCGARLDIVNNAAKTALAVAGEAGFGEVAALIEKEDADRKERQWKLNAPVTVKRLRLRHKGHAP